MGKPVKNNNSNQPTTKTVTIEQTTHWNGPIPPPSILADFERLVPGSAQKIIEMAHSQSIHRMEIEKIAVVENFSKAKRGQVFGFILGVFGIISSGILGYLGHGVLAGTIATVSMGTLAVALVLGSKARRRSLDKKDS